LITLKVVYYGAGLCGKTTNLLELHKVYPREARGDLVQLDTETERTLFFDYFPAELGTISGYRLKAEFYTVPGQSFYNATRRVVLNGADGLVFVVDSSAAREEANLVAWKNLLENLATYGRTLDSVPVVLQWNKRDVKDALPVRTLERLVNDNYTYPSTTTRTPHGQSLPSVAIRSGAGTSRGRG
jgi:hypothetical protein